MTGNLLGVVMGGKKNRFSRYVRLGFVVLAFVLYPYFVNYLPKLNTILPNLPPWAIAIAAIIFAAIVVVGPELRQESETSEEELFREFGKKNLEIVKERLKSSLDRHCYIAIDSKDSLKDVGKSPKTGLTQNHSLNPIRRVGKTLPTSSVESVGKKVLRANSLLFDWGGY